MENNVDPDQTPHSVASDLGLNCLLRPLCPNTSGYYVNKASQVIQIPSHKTIGAGKH